MPACTQGMVHVTKEWTMADMSDQRHRVTGQTANKCKQDVGWQPIQTKDWLVTSERKEKRVDIVVEEKGSD